MVPKVSYPIVVVGPIANGAGEHPAIITRVWDDHCTTIRSCVVNAVMFPDGGGAPVFQNQIRLCDTREEALRQAGPFRTAYWAANS